MDLMLSYNTTSIGPMSVTVFVTHHRADSSSDSSNSAAQQAGVPSATVEQQ
jgi:hypothetical protein